MGQCWSAGFRFPSQSRLPALLSVRVFSAQSRLFPSAFTTCGLVFAVLVILCPVLLAQPPAQSSPSQMPRAAEKADVAGESDLAIKLYSAALAQSPEWSEGWWKYGGLLYEKHRFGDAAQAFGRLTRIAPENPLGFALLGLCEYEQQDWENSGLHLQRALAFRLGLTEPIRRAATYHLGLVFMQKNDGAAALLVFKRLFYAAPDYPGLGVALGAAELNLQEVPQQTSLLDSAVRRAGEAAIATFEDRKKDAEQAYRSLLAQFPKQPFVHLDYGMLLESEHRDDDAIAEFLAETKLNPQSPAAWLWLGRITLDEGRARDARAYALQARARDANDPLSYLIEGRSYMFEHDWENALQPLRQAEKLSPQSSEVHYALATVCGALKRTDEAKQERQLFLQTSKAEQAQ
jgi:predicted Zn-dependent protease